MSKVKLTETENQPDAQFEGFVALEDFWPRGNAPDAKPRMLNGHQSLNLLDKKAAEPWSAAVRPHVHRHSSLVQASNASNSSKVAPQKPSHVSSNTSKVVPQKASNASKAVNASSGFFQLPAGSLPVNAGFLHPDRWPKAVVHVDVVCGNHKAKSCEECPPEKHRGTVNGEAFCHNQCHWNQGNKTCVTGNLP